MPLAGREVAYGDRAGLMEPRIQYAKTSDGVNIAFWTLGQGDEALIVGPANAFSHIEREWQIPEYRAWYERLAANRTVVRFDSRDQGLSDRDPRYFYGSSFTRDVGAVMERLDFDQFAFLGQQHSGPIMMSAAIKYADRVSHLILWCTWARGTDSLAPELRGLGKLMETNWDLYAEAVSHSLLGWSKGDTAHSFADVVKAGATKETAQRLMRGALATDMTEYLPRLKVATLVLHRRDVPLPNSAVAKQLASEIAGSRLVFLEGTSIAPWLGDTEAVLSAINDFLGVDAALVRPSGDMYTILFTDMASSTTLADQHGDAAAQEVRRAHNEIVRSAVGANGGTEIKHTGDGIMASFATASAALDAAIAIQRGVAAHKEEQPKSPLGVYVGLNAGEPIVEDDDLFGTSINLAARICDRAEAGQILAADVVRQLAAGKQFLFADLGETELRGFEDPVKLWELRWQEE